METTANAERWTKCCWINTYYELEDGTIQCARCLHSTQLSDDPPTDEQLAFVADMNQDGQTTEEEKQTWYSKIVGFLTGK